MEKLQYLLKKELPYIDPYLLIL